MFTANKRTIGLLVLFLVILFYAIGTGFPFFHRLLYVVLFLIAIGGVWAWVSLRGLELRVSRTGDRGQVGGYLEGRVTITNRTWMPKSWLEVAEVAGASLEPGGRGLSLDRKQVRSWRIETHLARRGVFEGGQVRVVSQDPFGLFRMGRNFHDLHTYIVYPATEPLPNLDSRFAGLPSFASSFQSVPVRTPSSRGALASAIARQALLSTCPVFILAWDRVRQLADSGTKNSCSSGSTSATSRGTPSEMALSTSSSKRSDNRFRNNSEKI